MPTSTSGVHRLNESGSVASRQCLALAPASALSSNSVVSLSLAPPPNFQIHVSLFSALNSDADAGGRRAGPPPPRPDALPPLASAPNLPYPPTSTPTPPLMS
ncbi:hypothetical protein NL676_034447 [Syzygium grande]|nr:hypothetical protein NL676_034447 [Syzygium grande]